jgi:DNA-binding CsgD family transcriptional regulator
MESCGKEGLTMVLSVRDYKGILEIIDIMYSEHDKTVMFRTVCDILHKFTGIYDAALFPYDQGTGKFCFIGYRSLKNPGDELVLCRDCYLKLDPLVAGNLLKNPNTVVRNTDFLPERNLTKSEFICDFLALVASVFHALASSLVVDRGIVAICSFHRKIRDGDFTKRGKDFLNNLLPHMAKAFLNLHLMNDMKANKKTGEVTSLGEYRAPLHVNENTERLIEGIHSAPDPDPGPGSYPTFFDREAGTYQGRTGPDSTDEKGRLMHLESYFDEDSLHQKFDRYKLTKREKELTTLVLNGYSNRNIAESLYISEQTVKDHLHNIFRKVEIKRRSELAARLLGLKHGFS